jgi:hypothetical protein
MDDRHPLPTDKLGVGPPSALRQRLIDSLYDLPMQPQLGISHVPSNHVKGVQIPLFRWCEQRKRKSVGNPCRAG